MVKCVANTHANMSFMPRCSEKATHYIVILGEKIKYCPDHAKQYGRGREMLLKKARASID